MFVTLSGQANAYKSSYAKWFVLIIILARIVMGWLLKMAFFSQTKTIGTPNWKKCHICIFSVESRINNMVWAIAVVFPVFNSRFMKISYCFASIFFSSCVHFFLLPDCDCTTKLWACAFFSTWILCSAIIWIHYIKCFFTSAKNPIIVRRDFQSTCIEDIKRIETPDLIYIFMQKKQKKIRKCFKIKTGSQRFQVFERLWHPLVNWMNMWI